MMSLRALVTALLLVGVAAFVPMQPSNKASATVLHFKFLKDLGLEKPSFLPDFGGKKEEEAAAAPAEDSEEGEGDAEEAAEEFLFFGSFESAPSNFLSSESELAEDFA